MIIPALVGALWACSVSTSQNRAVEIPGADAEARTQLAGQVIQVFLDSDPASTIRTRVPNASDSHLSELRVAPKRLVGASTKEGAVDLVYVQCTIKASLSDEIATRVLDACEALVEQHLEEVLALEPAA